MRGLRLLVLAGLAFSLAAAVPRPVESTHLKIIVGVTDDTAKWMSRQDGIVGVHRDLRLMAVRVTVPWKPGEVRPTKLQQIYLRRIARMIQLNDRIVLATYNVARYAPTAARERNQYCAFLRGVVRHLPLIHDVEIWNEANSPAYWPQDAGAKAYGALLARCYDVLHGRPGPINVISSTASRHDPVGFVFDLGDAYSSSLRTRPLFDTFGHNPYPENSAEPPWALHENSDLIAEGDYETLMNVLRTSFEGTPQPLPGTHGVSIWYVEDGFQTVAPPEKRRYYRGRENDVHAVPALAPRGKPPSSTRPHSSATRSCLRTASRRSPASSTSACSTRTDSEAGRPASSGGTGHANLRTTPSSRRSPRSAGETRTAARSAAHPQAERTSSGGSSNGSASFLKLRTAKVDEPAARF